VRDRRLQGKPQAQDYDAAHAGWPRIGISAQPGRPIFPVISARLQINCTHSDPYICSVTPSPQAIDARSASP